MEYDNDKTIVIKFQCGLDLALQNQVALLGDGAPDFGDLEGWYEAARRVFQNKEANKAFIETNRGVTRNLCLPQNLEESLFQHVRYSQPL